MSRIHLTIGALIATLAVGTWQDRVPENLRISIDGYEVLAVDFHVHPHPLAASALPPWDLIGQARRARLDAIAIVPHNIVWVGRIGRWFSEKTGGPIVLVGEEIANPRFHMVAAGIERTVPWNQDSSTALADVHAQGGIAIAAHPTSAFQAYSPDTARHLDGSEVRHPLAYGREQQAAELLDFNRRANVAAIGDSDFHGVGQIGVCRTYVFARDRSAAGILEAVRAHRTVVYNGAEAYGDQQSIDLAARDGRLPQMAHDMEPKPFVTIDGGIALVLFALAFLFGMPIKETS